MDKMIMTVQLHLIDEPGVGYVARSPLTDRKYFEV